MKTTIMSIAALFVALGVAFAQHDHGSHGQKQGSKMDHSMSKGMKKEGGQVASYESSPDFQRQLTAVYKTSMVLTESFITGGVTDVADNSTRVKVALDEVDMTLLQSSEAHMEWMMNLKEMNTAIVKISTSIETREQKAAFDSFNKALFKSIKAFGITEGAVYYQYCPMALDKQGAFWLSDSKEIRNPYFGGNMLTCGNTKDTIN